MIHGIGTDIVSVARVAASLERHGERFAARILALGERDEFAAARDPARFLAKRFAAKEAFGKALGTGVAVPATLHALAVAHDVRGRPQFGFSEELQRYMSERQLCAYLSLSDELDYVVAFTVIERHET